MSVSDISELILEHFRKGWSIELIDKHTPIRQEHTISSPDGTLYDTNKLRLNQCVICEDSDPEEWCRHTDEHNKEYEIAQKLGELVSQYVLRYGNTLPEL